MNAKTLLLIGSILMLVALFTPAATVSVGFLSKSMNGYETDLVFSGGIGFVTLLISLGTKPAPGKRFSVFAGILGIVALFIAGNIFLNVSALSLESSASTSTGMALPLTVIGALLATVGGFTMEPEAAKVAEPIVPA